MDTFSALATPIRRGIVSLLSTHKGLSASAISEHFQVTPSAISQHLKALRESGLVDMHKQAQQRIYTLNTEALRDLENWARQMTDELGSITDKVTSKHKK